MIVRAVLGDVLVVKLEYWLGGGGNSAVLELHGLVRAGLVPHTVPESKHAHAA